MKRLVSILLLAALVLAACGTSPKERTKEFLKYMPAEIGEWEQDDGETVQLLSSTVSSMGHVTLVYEGPDDALAYIVIEVHPGDDAAEVAAMSRERELRLQGLVFDADRAPQMVTAQVAQTDRVRYALMQEGSIVVEIDTLAAEGEDPVSDELFQSLLDAVRAAFAKVLEDTKS